MIVGGALLWMLFSGHAVAQPRSSSVLVLGWISDDPKDSYSRLKPLLDYVVPRMRDVGIEQGRILMARDPRQMASYLRRGQVDWVTQTVGAALLLQQRAEAEPLLLTERGGVQQYHTVFFVRKDSPIHSLSELRGHTIAFQNSLSTSAFFVPMATLLDHGVRGETLVSPHDRPGRDAVGYVFARTEANIATYVHKRLVDAGAFSNLDWADPAKVPLTYRHDLRIIDETVDVPRGLEMVRHDLDPRVRQRLREVLLEASSDPKAAQALHEFFGATGFYPMDGASERALQQFNRSLRRVRAETE